MWWGGEEGGGGARSGAAACGVARARVAHIQRGFELLLHRGARVVRRPRNLRAEVLGLGLVPHAALLRRRELCLLVIEVDDERAVLLLQGLEVRFRLSLGQLVRTRHRHPQADWRSGRRALWLLRLRLRLAVAAGLGAAWRGSGPVGRRLRHWPRARRPGRHGRAGSRELLQREQRGLRGERGLPNWWRDRPNRAPSSRCRPRRAPAGESASPTSPPRAPSSLAAGPRRRTRGSSGDVRAGNVV